MGDSIEGPVMDRFHESGAGYQYLSLRNQHGAGKQLYIPVCENTESGLSLGHQW